VRLEDFGEFFGYAGKMDLFFNANIAKYVDTITRPWTRLRGGDTAVRLSAQAIAMFERANAVKEGFFRGDKKPYVAFELTPISMDANINRFTLAVDGKTVSYFNGPIISEFLEWPGPAGTGRVRMEMAPAAGTSLRLENGPWAWFRILDSSNLRSTNQSERFLVDFSLGGRSARYELVARSAYNPFKLAELHTFQCVSRLTR
jgi:type VI secretion system protein ImpL